MVSRFLDGHDSIANFDHVFLGPGVYVLFDGRVADSNIVYIGKSTREVMMRVSSHQRDKEFDRVGVILPRETSAPFIHNLEALVLAEYLDLFGDLPQFNLQNAHVTARGPLFNWHSIARRTRDVCFGSTEDFRPSLTSSLARGVSVGTKSIRGEMLVGEIFRVPESGPSRVRVFTAGTNDLPLYENVVRNPRSALFHQYDERRRQGYPYRFIVDAA